MTEVLLVALGGALGAALRHAVALAMPGPRATLLVNVSGSLLLGAVAAGSPGWLLTLLGSAVAGALTTYSAFALESVRLAPRRAAINVLATLVLGSAAFAVGWWLGG
jgi:CrcB protein